MPQVPKPKRETKKARKKWNRAKPWLQVPEAPATEDVSQSISLFSEADEYRAGLDMIYRIQKARAVTFSKKGLQGLPSWVWGICLCCGTYLKRGRAPQAHHWCIRRSAGVTVNHWWNLWPLCSEDCHHNIENDTVGRSVANEHYQRIARYHLQLSSELPIEKLRSAGRAWILAGILELVGAGDLDERQPYYLPPVEETEDD